MASKKRQERRERNFEKLKTKYEREWKQRYRKNKSEHLITDQPGTPDTKPAFKYRMNKKRAVDRLKSALPTTPNKRRAVITAYLKNKNPPCLNSIQMEVVTPEPEVADTVMKNLKEILSNNKMKRSKEKRTEMHTVIASISGENMTKNKCKSKLAQQHGVSVKTITGGQG